MLFIEKLFLRIFCKQTMWLVRLGIFAGAIDCICYITYVVNNVPNWDWIDFCGMPFFEIWVFGFIQIGVPYLLIAHVMRWFIPTIDESFAAWQREKIHLWHLFIYIGIIFLPILGLLVPIPEWYADTYYFGDRKHRETRDEILDRFERQNYKRN